MAHGTLTESLDNLYTTTWQNMKAAVADQIFDATPFWFWLKAHGGMEPETGGRFIAEPLRFAKTDNVKWFVKGDTVVLADKEFLTTAIYQWRYLADSIVRFGIDEQQNRGKNQIINLLNAKLDNSRDTLIEELETRLGGGASTNEMNGLLDIVPIDPTASGATLGGIDPSVDTWWRNKFDTTGYDLSAVGMIGLMNLLNDTTNNIRQDSPNIFVSSQSAWEAYWATLLDQKRFSNTALADAGFMNVEFQGVPWIWSPAITAGYVYMLNTRFMKFRFDPQMFFDMTEWKSIPEQINDRAAQIVLAGNLTTNRRRVHAVATAIT